MIFGILIVLIGVAIIVKAVFHIDLPIFRILVGVFLLYLGVQLILGWPRWRWRGELDHDAAIFSYREYRLGPGEQPERSYSMVFGKTLIDLSELKAPTEDADVEVHVVFGQAVVRVNPAVPLVVEANVAFGNASLPDRTQVVVGKQVYRSENAETAPHKLHIRANVVFGSLELQRG